MYSRYRILPLLAAALAAMLLSACDTDKPTTLQDSIVPAGAISDYDLAESILPFPNDLLFQGTTDGTINIPVADETHLADPQVAINGLEGFSTLAPISTGFSAALDPASISGTSVRLYEVAFLAGPGTPIDPASITKLTFGVDYAATVSTVDPTGSTLVIVPLRPLEPRTGYAVLITNALLGSDGNPVGASASYLLTRGSDPLIVSPPSTPISVDDILADSLRPAADATQAEIDEAYSTAATLDAVRSVVNPSEDALVAADTELESTDVILHWTFSTQSITDVLAATRSQNRENSFTPFVTGFLPIPVADSPLGAADIHAGALEVPYYLTASDTSSSPSVDPTALGSYWQGPGNTHLSYLVGNVTPVATSTEVIPLLVSIPKAIGACASGMPGSGWPVVIFQHGLTRTRADMLAIADAMAGACLAVVAIDLPMHGVTGNESDGTQLFRDNVNGERTFDLDLVTQDQNETIIAQVPDGIIDTSGRHYVNLSNLLNGRDNLRQSISDLFTLVHAIESGALTDGANMFDDNRIYLLAHSMGAIVGPGFLALESSVTDAALAFGGSGIAKILDGSATYGPEIAAGLLTVAGVEKGTPDYEAFVGAAQTVIDSADPGNHAVGAVSSNTNRGVLFFEIVGDGTPENPSDLVVPNTVPDSNDTLGTVAAPLAGTEPLLALMGLTQFNNSTTGIDLKVVTKYVSGAHSSLLDPTPNLAVTTELQTQAANFFASDGAALVVTDPSVLQAPAP